MVSLFDRFVFSPPVKSRLLSDRVQSRGRNRGGHLILVNSVITTKFARVALYLALSESYFRLARTFSSVPSSRVKPINESKPIKRLSVRSFLHSSTVRFPAATPFRTLFRLFVRSFFLTSESPFFSFLRNFFGMNRKLR